jgi:hypothetical protein
MRIPEQARCGSWDSPISAELVVAQGIRLFQPQLAGDRTYWLESRPRESGRTALVCRHPDGRREDVVPEPFSVRSRVHEYGGGAYLATDERVLFVENSDQQIYEVQPGSTPERLTAAARRRHADLQWDAARERIVCVCEAHGADGEPQNFLAAVGPEGDATALASGRDFYSGPRMAADGRHLAWLAWDHPNLPWDGTDLLVARVGADGSLETPIRVAGGAISSPIATTGGTFMRGTARPSAASPLSMRSSACRCGCSASRPTVFPARTRSSSPRPAWAAGKPTAAAWRAGV